jgi:hypothetical protein
MPTKRATSPRSIVEKARAGRALEMRLAGHTFERIARDLGYKDRTGAYHAVSRSLKATIREPADALRKVECERLDKMQAVLWPKVEAGDLLAMRQCLSVMERRAKLLGLDAPVRKTIDVVTHDAFSKAMEELEGEIAALEASGQAAG